MHAPDSLATQPVVARLEDFDTASGSWPERLLFNHRPWVMLLCLLATLLLGWQATKLTLNASFDKTLPKQHPYIVNFLAHRGDLGAQGNAVRIVVEARQGTIYDRHYLAVLQKISDELYLMPGVDRPFMIARLPVAAGD